MVESADSTADSAIIPLKIGLWVRAFIVSGSIRYKTNVSGDTQSPTLVSGQVSEFGQPCELRGLIPGLILHLLTSVIPRLIPPHWLLSYICAVQISTVDGILRRKIRLGVFSLGHGTFQH